MHLSLLSSIFKLKIISKAIAFRCGSLLGVSIPLSIGYLETFKMLFKNVSDFDVTFSIASVVSCFIFYTFFWISDFFYGLIASHHENKGKKGWVRSHKLFSSFGKIAVIALVDSALIALIMFLLIGGFRSFAIVTLFFTVIITFLAMLFELHSIGENIERRSGKKPPLFEFFERLTKILEKILFSRIMSLFKSKDSPEKIQVNDSQEIKPENLEK